MVNTASPLRMMGVATNDSADAHLPWSASTNRIVNGGPGSARVPSDLPTSRDLDLSNCNAYAPFIEAPPLKNTNLSTRICFFVEHGVTAWPQTSCCEISKNETNDCSPPSFLDALEMMLSIQNYGNRYANDPRLANARTPVQSATPTFADGLLVGAAMSLILDNLDIVNWATCLVQTWSPQTVGLTMDVWIRTLLSRDSSGFFPFSITYVQLPTEGNRNATMWAFTYDKPAADGSIGLIVPLGTGIWQSQASDWEAGQGQAFCAAVQVAATILHELVHIVGDHYIIDPDEYGAYESPFSWLNLHGTNHEEDLEDDPISGTNYPCWDEARMISTIFLWAMAKRYTCLTESNYCQNMSNDRFFAYSSSTLAQLRNA